MVYCCSAHQPEDLNGNFEVFYQRGYQSENNIWQNEIIRARSEDGLKWLDFEKPVIKSFFTDLIFKQIRAPFIFQINNKYILYFSALGKDEITRIFLAESFDRENWIIKHEPILEPKNSLLFKNDNKVQVSGMTDPCVVRLPNNTLRMYFSVILDSLKHQHIATAISTDGISWFREQDEIISAGEDFQHLCACNGTVIPFEDGWRIYYRASEIYPLWNSIYTSFSKDGLNWEKGVECLRYQRWNINERNAVAFPFVIKINESSYRMYYTGYWGFLFDKNIIKQYS